MTSSSQTGPRLLLRLLISLAVGAVVTVAALMTAWRSHGVQLSLSTEETFITAEQMTAIAREVWTFRERTGWLPATLGELSEATEPDGARWWSWNDGWGHPLVYSVEGNDYALTSLGRDGSPGGTGLDSDLTRRSSQGFLPFVAAPTLTQFFHDLPTSGIIWGCVGSGLLAAMAALVTIRTPDLLLRPRGMLALAVKLVVVTLLAFGLALWLSALELLPMGGGH